MLHAILKGKYQDEKQIEDTLTSSVFERLFYLPTDIFWRILRNACYADRNTKGCTEFFSENPPIIEKDFWGKWYEVEDTQNKRYVEPDLFISTANFDLIIEAKRWDDKRTPQELTQWQNQIKAYKAEKDVYKQLFYIALGGLESEKMYYDIPNVPIIKCRWQGILVEVDFLLTKMRLVQGEMGSIDGIVNILQDIVAAFAHHGYYISKSIWLENSTLRAYKLKRYDSNFLKQLKHL